MFTFYIEDHESSGATDKELPKAGSSIYRTRSSTIFWRHFGANLGPILYPLCSKNWSLDRLVAIV